MSQEEPDSSDELETSEEAIASPPPKRPWYRRRLTYPIAALLVIVIVLAGAYAFHRSTLPSQPRHKAQRCHAHIIDYGFTAIGEYQARAGSKMVLADGANEVRYGFTIHNPCDHPLAFERGITVTASDASGEAVLRNNGNRIKSSPFYTSVIMAHQTIADGGRFANPSDDTSAEWYSPKDVASVQIQLGRNYSVARNKICHHLPVRITRFHISKRDAHGWAWVSYDSSLTDARVKSVPFWMRPQSVATITVLNQQHTLLYVSILEFVGAGHSRRGVWLPPQADQSRTQLQALVFPRLSCPRTHTSKP